MKRFLAVLAVAAVLVALPLARLDASSQSWTGWIADDQCKAKGASADHKECAERCFARGAKAILVTADEKVFLLDNQDLAKQHVGHEVKVTGQLDGDSIEVESIEATAPAEG
jgi:hypothetical protein